MDVLASIRRADRGWLLTTYEILNNKQYIWNLITLVEIISGLSSYHEPFKRLYSLTCSVTRAVHTHRGKDPPSSRPKAFKAAKATGA